VCVGLGDYDVMHESLEVKPNNIDQLLSYLTENTLHLHYIDQPDNGVSRDNRSLLGQSYKTHKCTLRGKIQFL
jgi:hypothetical protein